jgi:hypothetical protein
MSNDLPDRQNSPEFIRLLRARSQAYREAGRYQGAQLVLTAVVPVASAVLGVFVPEARPFVAATAIAISLIDLAILDRSMRRALKTSALISETFDCRLFDIPWDPFVAGRLPEPELIADAERRWTKGDGQLTSWYPPIVGTTTLPLARIICQRTNLWYDAALRERYSNYLLLGATAMVFLLFAAGLIANLKFADFVLTVLAPSAPLLSWSLREVFRQRDAADAQRTARAEAEMLWTQACAAQFSSAEIDRKSREFQNAIFQRRVSNPLLFPFIYRIFRASMEADMNLGAADLLAQIKAKTATPASIG